MCVGILPAFVHVYHVNVSCPWRPGEAIRSPETGIPVVVGYHDHVDCLVDLGTEPGSSARAIRTLNHRAPPHLHPNDTLKQ